VTPDNAQPTVITAAEFVSGGYAQRVAAGECVVYSGNAPIRDVVPFIGGGATVFFSDDYYDFNDFTEEECKFTVHWLPAIDELASLRAQVARYRAALERMKRHIASAEKLERKIYDRSPELVLYETLTRIADAALAETEEAK